MDALTEVAELARPYHREELLDHIIERIPQLAPFDTIHPVAWAY